jgi:hypothetical protein
LKDYVKGEPTEGAAEISRWAREHGLGEETLDKIKPDIEFTDTIERIKKFTGMKEIKLDDIPIDVIKGIETTLTHSVLKFPELKTILTELKVNNTLTKATAQTYSVSGIIEVNGRNFKAGMQALQALVDENIKKGYWPKGVKWYSPITHEVGHIIDAYLTKNVLKKAYIAGGEENISGTLRKNVIKLLKLNYNDVILGLSIYGSGKPTEFIAEAFSEYMDSVFPRKIAQAVGEQIEYYFKELRK